MPGEGHRAALSGGNEEIGMHWPQPLTFGLIAGLFAFALHSSYAKWLSPRLSKRAAAAGNNVTIAAGVLFPFCVGVAEDWMPAFILPFAVVGTVIGLMFGSWVKAHFSRDPR